MTLLATLIGRVFKTQKQRINNCCSRSGFTLVEILIVFGIFTILIVASTPLYSTLHVRSQLNENTSHIIQSLRIARERSVARLNDSSYGIYFSINPNGNDQFVLYQGDSYFTRNSAYDKTIILNNTLSLSTSLEGNDVSFSKGLGVPNNFGMISLAHVINGSRNIVVNKLGGVEEE